LDDSERQQSQFGRLGAVLGSESAEILYRPIWRHEGFRRT